MRPVLIGSAVGIAMIVVIAIMAFFAVRYLIFYTKDVTDNRFAEDRINIYFPGGGLDTNDGVMINKQPLNRLLKSITIIYIHFNIKSYTLIHFTISKLFAESEWQNRKQNISFGTFRSPNLFVWTKL